MNTFFTKSFTQTQQLAEKLMPFIGDLQAVALHGNLGSGKTTFIQGLANKLGIKHHLISPSFIIIRMYELPYPIKTKKYFYHIDLYRISDDKDVENLGLKEILQDPQSLTAIEWPEKIENLLPKATTHLYFEYQNENERKIKF